MPEHNVAPALPSATVILVRDGEDGPEVLMVKRHERTVFGSLYAFPGGVVCEDDSEAQHFFHGIGEKEANQRLGLDHDGLRFYSAAVRELFEETGVLLVRDAGKPGNQCLEQLRADHANSKSRWSVLCREHELEFTGESMHYIGYWETPLSLPSRFATRFFLAAMPPGQEVKVDGRELVDGQWMTPANALQMTGTGELPMLFPTLNTLESISEFSSIDKLDLWARHRWKSGIAKVRPDLSSHD